LTEADFTYLNPTPGEEEVVESNNLLRGASAEFRI